MRTLLAWAGDDPARSGPDQYPQARGRGLRGALQRLSRGSGRRARPHLRGRVGLSRHDPAARRAPRKPLRAPHRAVHRYRARRLSAGQAGCRAVEARTRGRHLRSPAAGAGVAHGADRRNHPAEPRPARRRRDDPRRPPVHDAARRQPARGHHGDDALHRRLRQGRELAPALPRCRAPAAPALNEFSPAGPSWL